MRLQAGPGQRMRPDRGVVTVVPNTSRATQLPAAPAAAASVRNTAASPADTEVLCRVTSREMPGNAARFGLKLPPCCEARDAGISETHHRPALIPRAGSGHRNILGRAACQMLHIIHSYEHVHNCTAEGGGWRAAGTAGSGWQARRTGCEV